MDGGDDGRERRKVKIVVPGHFDHEQTEQLIAKNIPEGFELDTSVLASMLGNDLIVDGFNRPASSPPPKPIDYTFSFGIVRQRG